MKNLVKTIHGQSSDPGNVKVLNDLISDSCLP